MRYCERLVFDRVNNGRWQNQPLILASYLFVKRAGRILDKLTRIGFPVLSAHFPRNDVEGWHVSRCPGGHDGRGAVRRG